VTIQAGLTGPPHVPELRLRVWSDRPGSGDIAVKLASTGAPIPGATVSLGAVPPVPPPPPDRPQWSVPFRRVVEIGALPPDTLVRVEMGGESCTALTPPAEDGELRFLIGSCFYLPDDRGQLAMAYAKLRDQDRPHIRIMGGDQLYLDAGELPGGPTELARTLARYRDYWQHPVHCEYLRGGITLFAPDDHDYWNDYPYFMPHLRRSWNDQWRQHAVAAETAYRLYQALGNPGGRKWFTLDLGIVSLFVMDTRSQRGSDARNQPRQLFDAVQRNALLQWSATLQKPGVLLSAMPLFQKPEGKFLFYTTDHNLLYWGPDARQIWRAVENAPFSVLVLAGDIHRGVASEWQTGPPGSVRQHYEVVSSPLRLLGWPVRPKREAGIQPGGLQLGEDLGRRDIARTFYGTSTDHFTLLRFRRDASGVRVTVSVHVIPEATTPVSEVGSGGPCRTEFHLREA
jgi:hypothetical protein